ncbi:MAG: hypothetical protein IPL95_00445 [Saprospiraceae bacterium]|nr:hypothetical protein [Saprospiraceae bacterium]
MTSLVLKNPYPGFEKGLNKPFGESDREYFYGRQNDINKIKLKLRQDKLVVLKSLPRAGKTSLIEAGLIPALESKGYLTQFSNDWKFLKIECKGDPILNLANALSNATYLYKNKVKPNLEEIFYQQFLKKDTALKHYFEDNPTLKKINLLLIIDDFNLLFEEQSKKDKSLKFIKLIYQLSLSKSLSVYTLISLNNNDLKEPLLMSNPDILKKFNESVYQLHNLDINDLKMAIVAPAKKEDVNIEEVLCQTIIDELYLQPDQLPKLQRYLNRTWWEFKNHKNKESSISLKLFNIANGTNSKKIDDELSLEPNPITSQTIESQLEESNELRQPESNFVSLGYHEIYLSMDPSLQKCCQSIIGILANSPKKQISFDELATITNTNRHEITDVVYKFPEVFLQKSDSLILQKTKSELQKDWSQSTEWIEKEAENIAFYISICEATVKHYIEEIPLENVLSRVDFVNALLWKNKFKPKESWANLHNSQFEMAMDLLEKAKLELGFENEMAEEKMVNEKKTIKIGIQNTSSSPSPIIQIENNDEQPIKKIVLKKK